MRLRHFGWFIPAVAALTLCGMSAPLRAQAPSAPPSPAGGLTLSPAEQARYNARLQQFNQAVTALRADKILTPAQKQAKFQAMTKALDADMLAILTPAQRAQVLNQRQQQSQKAATFQKAHSAEIAQGKALADKLNKSLTPAQKAKMSKIGADTRAQMAQVDADKTLSPDAKRAKEQAIYQSGETRALAVLTPAQQVDLKKMQAMQKQLVTEAGNQPHP